MGLTCQLAVFHDEVRILIFDEPAEQEENIYKDLLFSSTQYMLLNFKVVMVPRIFWTPDSGPEKAHPWEHKPCSLATCVLPMKLSMVDQHLNMQRCP